MANEPNSEQVPAGEGAEGAPAPKKPKPALTYLVVGIATVLGGVVGTMVIAPRVIASRTPKAEAQSGEGKEKGAEGKEKGADKRPLVKIDNLIVNPAGSQGSRFLMVSLAIQTDNAQLEERLRAQEPQIRDVAIALLEQKTMEMLSQPGIRDSIKQELTDTIAALTGSPNRLRVYLPQFVIQ